MIKKPLSTTNAVKLITTDGQVCTSNFCMNEPISLKTEGDKVLLLKTKTSLGANYIVIPWDTEESKEK